MGIHGTSMRRAVVSGPTPPSATAGWPPRNWFSTNRKSLGKPTWSSGAEACANAYQPMAAGHTKRQAGHERDSHGHSSPAGCLRNKADLHGRYYTRCHWVSFGVFERSRCRTSLAASLRLTLTTASTANRAAAASRAARPDARSSRSPRDCRTPKMAEPLIRGLAAI